MPRAFPRHIPLADKLIGFAAIAAVGLPMTAPPARLKERR